MQPNPFDDEHANFHVLRNNEKQYSLWPTQASVPEGWNVVHAEDTREHCLNFIEENWVDMRPASLVEKASEGRHISSGSELQNGPPLDSEAQVGKLPS